MQHEGTPGVWGAHTLFEVVCLMFIMRIDKNMGRCIFLFPAISSVLLAPPVKDDRAQDQLGKSLENVLPAPLWVSVHFRR